MKAAVIHGFGGANVLRYEDVRTPEPGPGEILIKVAACGINRYDLYLRMGAVTQDIAFPHVMGADIAGDVAVLGADVTGWSVGERTIAAPGYPIDPNDWGVRPENRAPSFEVTGTHSWGGYAEYIRVPARFAIKDDTGLPQEEVAAMPLVLMTAIHAVEVLGGVRSPMNVLIQAGGSGSGNACIQVARALGARVATTIGSERKRTTATAAGAELVINHTQREFVQDVIEWTEGRGVDVVIDNVGASVFDDNLRILKPGGILVNFGLVGGIKATLNIRTLFFRQLQIRGSFMGSMDELRKGLDLLRDGKVRPFIDRRFSLSQAAEAHQYIESRAVNGKVILVP